MDLGDNDRRLVQLRRTDARMPVAKLAAQAGVSRVTAAAGIDRLRRDGSMPASPSCPSPCRAIRQIDGIANTDTSILLKARKTMR